jgi:hypothetical protein
MQFEGLNMEENREAAQRDWNPVRQPARVASADSSAAAFPKVPGRMCGFFRL